MVPEATLALRPIAIHSNAGGARDLGGRSDRATGSRSIAGEIEIPRSRSMGFVGLSGAMMVVPVALEAS